jgi:hypothetical protein
MAVDKALLKQLKHSDPKERRKAIVALANTRDAAALEPLAEVERTDSEPKLREAAQKAQAYIRQYMDTVEKVRSGSDVDLSRHIPEHNVQRAKEYVEEAMSALTIGNNDKAAKALANALNTNPFLDKDPYFLGVVGSVFGTSAEQGLKLLLDQKGRDQYIKQARTEKAQKRKGEHQSKADDLPWSSMWLDLGIYGIVVAVITFLTPLVFLQVFGNALNIIISDPSTMMALDAESFQAINEMSSFITSLQTAGLPLWIALALVYGFIGVVSMLLYSGVIHLIATRVLQGVGTIRYMMSQVVPFYTMVTAVYFVAFVIIFALVSQGGALVMLCAGPLSFFGSLYVLFTSAGRIGKAYDFGTGKGCLSLFIASLGLAALSYGCSLASSSILLNAISSTMGASLGQ